MDVDKTEVVFGRNPVCEVMRANRRKIHKLKVAKGVSEKGVLTYLLKHAYTNEIPIERVRQSDLDREGNHHQGVIAIVDPYPYADLDDILDRAKTRGEQPFILLLDALQDPQNLGTLLRTAEAVGVHGAVIPFRRGASVTRAVVSSSAGACEHLLIARGNLVQAIEKFKRLNVWIAGLEYHPEAQSFDEVKLDGAIGLVVGNEGQGMRKLVRKSCDYLVQIPMRGQVGTLNAAVAGSIALYTIWKNRGHHGARAAGG